MTLEQQHTAAAIALWKRHGDHALHIVGEHIRDLAMADDIPAVRRWQGVASALKTMREDNAQRPGARRGKAAPSDGLRPPAERDAALHAPRNSGRYFSASR